MADIFVSYAHVDHGPVKGIVGELERQGFSVWWDIAMRSGDAYTDVIEKELAGAKCVLSVWSRNSRNSTWVKAESSLANDTGKLVQVVLQKDVRPPLPFNIIHFEPLERGPSNSDQNWLDLLEAIRGRVGGAVGERAPPRASNPIETPAVLSALSALGVGGYLLSQALPQVGASIPFDPIYFGSIALVCGAGSVLLSIPRVAANVAAGG
jgi:hypothetical protein